MKDGEILKKIVCSLILLLILPTKISAIKLKQDINSGIVDTTYDGNLFTSILALTLGIIGILLLLIKLYIDNKEKI